MSGTRWQCEKHKPRWGRALDSPEVREGWDWSKLSWTGWSRSRSRSSWPWIHATRTCGVGRLDPFRFLVSMVIGRGGNVE